MNETLPRGSRPSWPIFSIILIVAGSVLLLLALSEIAIALTPEPIETPSPKGTLEPIVMYARQSPNGWLSAISVGLCAMVAIASGVRRLARWRRNAQGEPE
jgi:hypothetical protein